MHPGVDALLYILGEGIGGHCNNGNGLTKGVLTAADGHGGLVTGHFRHLHIHMWLGKMVVVDRKAPLKLMRTPTYIRCVCNHIFRLLREHML